ncbi:MAG TPA: FAD-binding oxidoreductase [Thermoleophilia bacterium]|nr:FAD-binding oxidoreductase [Thermoleophilia bacterium]
MGGDPRWDPEPAMTPLTRRLRADVCVVGGGFTGLWSALELKRLAPDGDVVVVEQQFCGSGASGRNGGWINGWEDVLPNLTRLFGAQHALGLLELSRACVARIAEVVADGGIDCDLAFGGGLVIATSEAQMRAMRETATALAAAGKEELVGLLGREEALSVSGVPKAVGGFLLPKAGSVQPALLVQGLRRLAIEMGVRVFEASPMVNLDRGLPAIVETPAGSVVADKVILAGGSWLARLPELRRTLFIIPAHIVATEPLKGRLDEIGWRCGRPFADGRTSVHYAQRTTDDRLVFGRGGGRLGFAGRIIPEHYHDGRETAEIVDDLRRLIPALAAARMEWAWGGPVDRSQHGMPWVGTLGRERNIHYGVGYCGNGIASTPIIGRTLASIALGLDDDYTRSPLVSDPPTYLPVEPARYVGARAVRSAVNRCENKEDAGLRPDPISGLLRRALNLSMPKGIQVLPLAARLTASKGARDVVDDEHADQECTEGARSGSANVSPTGERSSDPTYSRRERSSPGGGDGRQGRVDDS